MAGGHRPLPVQWAVQAGFGHRHVHSQQRQMRFKWKPNRHPVCSLGHPHLTLAAGFSKNTRNIPGNPALPRPSERSLDVPSVGGDHGVQVCQVALGVDHRLPTHRVGHLQDSRARRRVRWGPGGPGYTPALPASGGGGFKAGKHLRITQLVMTGNKGHCYRARVHTNTRNHGSPSGKTHWVLRKV